MKNEKIILNKQKILEAAEQILLSNCRDVIIDDLAKEVDMAKGTIYKYFKNKNQIYLELLIQNEKKLLEISINYGDDIKVFLSNFMLYHLNNSNRTIKFHEIEEQVTSQERKFKSLFDELYAIREKRIIEMKDITSKHLQMVGSFFSVSEFFSYVWGITYGLALFLSSNFYKQSVQERERLINFHIARIVDIQ